MGGLNSKAVKPRKVAVLGAAGGIGQPLSMLMKSLPEVKELVVYDVVPVIKGVAADLSHMDTDCKVSGYCDPLGSNSTEQLDLALKDCELVIIPAGVPRKPGMTRDDLFKINAGIVKNLCEAVARNCPNAWVNIISNPVNSTVPIAKAVFEKAGTYNKKKLFGVTTLDVLRANTFISEKKGLAATKTSVPVVGGHAGVTILPLLSQTTPKCEFDQEELSALTTRIQNGGTEVVEAKQGAGSATLSMAYAAYKFAILCLKAMGGQSQVACSYVDSTVVEGLEFFSSKVKLGPSGAEEVMGLGELTEFEKGGLEALKAELAGSIKKGLEFVNGAE